MDEDIEFLLEVALEFSDDEEVNYHIRTALQYTHIEHDNEKLESE